MRIVSSKYRVIETSVMNAKIVESIHGLGLNVNIQHSWLSSSRDLTVYSFPELKTNALGGITPTIRFYNSYDGSSSAKFKVGFLREVCSNGMTVGTHLFQERIIHIKGRSTEQSIEEVPYKVAAAIAYLQKSLMPLLHKLDDTEVSKYQMLTIATGLKLPKAVTKSLVESVLSDRVRPTYDKNNSLFSLYNMANELVRKNKRTTDNSADKYNANLLRDICTLAEVA